MNVLEKILEEIKKEYNALFQHANKDYFNGIADMYLVTKNIIRSHMDGISKTTDVQEVEWIDVDNAIRILENMQSPKIDYAEMVGAPAFCYGKRYVFQNPEDYAIETALAALNEKKERDARRAKDTNIIGNDGWIPVEERLPEEDDGKKYIVTDEHGLVCSEMEYGQPVDGNREVCFHKWDDEYWSCYRPKAIAWQPLPEPYKPKKDISAAGTEHVMSRFMKVEVKQ